MQHVAIDLGGRESQICVRAEDGQILEERKIAKRGIEAYLKGQPPSRDQITAEFLAYLAELDERQIFLDLGFASLFEYCVEALGLCESTAGRHIAAARVCRNHPQVFALVASGALHASALSLLRKHLSPENARELFELCAHRSARKVEELLAARFPRPDVRDLVRRLPAQAGLTPDVERASEKCASEKPTECARRACLSGQLLRRASPAEARH